MKKLPLLVLLFIIFGFSTSPASAIAPSNGTWIPDGNITTPLIYFSGTLLQNGKVLIAGGQESTQSNPLSQSELYDPLTKTWSETGSLLQSRLTYSPAMVTLHDGKALIVAGNDQYLNDYGTAEIYNPTTGNWSFTGSLNTSRRDANLMLLNDGRVLIAGGSHLNSNGDRTYLHTSEIYNPNTGIWSYVGNTMESHITGAIVKLNDGRVLLAGGSDPSSQWSNVAEIFNPSTNTWSSAGMLPYGVKFFTMIALPDGRVLAAGGVTNNDVFVNYTSLYNPATNSWTEASPLQTARGAAFALLLSSGQVMIGGGNQAISIPNSSLQSTEIYDSSTNTWASGPSLTEPRSASVTVSLDDGSVLNVGGFGNPFSNTALSTTEIFTTPNLNIDLPVPLLKQTDPLWGSQTYDSADKWSPLHPTIGYWGCAETSAAMILQYYGITKLPDGTLLDPGTLNTWLKSQPDGYVKTGWVNWLTIAKMTKQAKPQNPNFTYDSLEYKKIYNTDTSTLLADLQNNQPDILEEPGHFVVGTGHSGNTFTINDPYYTRTDLTQGYSNTFLSLGRFVPSHTDLSYIMFVTDANTHLELKTASGSAIGESSIESPILSDPDGTPSSTPITEYLVPQPPSGTYFLTVTGNNNAPFSVDPYFYDKDGNVVLPATISGTLSSSGTHTIEITFDNQSANNDQITPNITFDSLLTDINTLQNQNQLQNGEGNAIAALAKNAAKSSDKKNSLSAKVQLIALQGLLDVFHSRGVSDQAYNLLQFDVQYLLNSL